MLSVNVLSLITVATATLSVNMLTLTVATAMLNIYVSIGIALDETSFLMFFISQ